MKHILVICPYCPYPPEDGGKLCVYGRLIALSEDFAFHLVCPPPYRLPADEASEARAALSRYCRTVHFYELKRPGPSSLPATLLALFYVLSPRPVALRQALGRDIEKICLELAAQFPIHAVSLEHSYTHGLIADMLRGKRAALFASTAICACEQNAEHRIWEDAAKDPLASRPYRFLAAREAVKMLRYTRRVYAQLDRAICISSADRDELRAKTECTQIFLGRVVIPEPAQRKTNFARNLQVIFSSTVGYFANRDGLIWLYREIWPLVVSKCGAARLVVTGRPDKQIAAILGSDPSVDLTGFLSEDALMTRMLESSVFVSPIRLGSGIKLKNIVALSCGMPIVATSESMRGICVQDRRDAWLADDAIQFAEAIVTLLGSVDAQRAYSDNAHRFFKNNHTPFAAAGDWRSFYEDAHTRISDDNRE